MALRIVVISDTHGMHERIAVPAGDVLVHTGDLTAHGTLEDLRAFNAWLGRLPHRHKLIIAGNHDWICAEEPALVPQILDQATYLCDSGVTIGRISFYGSPWQPRFLDWAFNLDRMPLRRVWSQVPTGVDVLMTHTPPAGILDRTMLGQAAGCAELRAALPRIRPRLHLFGHIHEGYGQTQQDGTTFVNASACTLNYQPINPPLAWDLE
ncbi:MAG: metallophosphatase domain-containing protein [Oscillochloridaceae bacterium umkhey_bin13]